MGVAGEDHAFELGVREELVADDAFGKHGPVGGGGMGNRGHGGGLHERGRVRRGVVHEDRSGTPGAVGARGRVVFGGRRRGGRVVEFGDRAPVAFGGGRRGLGGGDGCGGPVGNRLGGVAEEIGDGSGFHREARRDVFEDGFEEGLRVGGDERGVVAWRGGRGGGAVEDGDAGLEAGSAARVGAAVDSGREDGVKGRVERGECVLPVLACGAAMGRGDGDQAAPRGKHGGRGTDVAKIGAVPGAADIGADREGRVHQDDGGAQVREAVADGFGVVAGERGVRKEVA